MKKRLGCLAFLGLGVALYAGWVMTPRARYPVEAKAMVERSAARYAEQSKRAQNKETNGYLNPVLLPFWGRKKDEAQPRSEAQTQLSVIDNLCDLRKGEDTDVEKAVREKNPEVAKRFAQFARFYPVVREVCHKPDFLVPYETPPDTLRLVPNWLAMRSLAQYGGGYAEYLTLTGKTDEALEVASDMVRFGWLMGRQQGGLMQQMVAIALQSMALNTAAMVLQTLHVPPSPEALEGLCQTLQATPIVRTDMLNAMDDEFYSAMNTFAQLTQKDMLDGNSSPNALFLYLPGFLEREVRLYQNDFLSLLESLKKGETGSTEAAWAKSMGFWSWLSGEHGYFSAILIPNLTRAFAQQELALSRQAFLHLFASLVREGLRQGKWPADLKQFEATGFKPMEGLDFQKVQYRVKGVNMELTANDVSDLKVSPPQPGMEEWNFLTGTTWKLQFQLKP